MAKGEIRVIGCHITEKTVARLLAEFAKQTRPIVTSVDPEHVPLLSQWIAASGQEVSFQTSSQLLSQCYHISNAGVRLPASSDALTAECIRVALRESQTLKLLPVSKFPGVQRRVASVIRQLWDAGHTVATLQSASLGVSFELSQKLDDLSQVMSRAETLLRQAGFETEAGSIMRLCGASLKEPISAPSYLFFGVRQLTALEILWIEWLSRNGSSVWVVQEQCAPSEDSFRHIAKLAARLKAKHEFWPEKAWFTSLFSSDQQVEKAPQLRIVTSADPLAEAENCLRAIYKLLQSGESASEIGIFVRDLEGYERLLELASKQFGVPISLRNAKALRSQPEIRWLLDLLRTSCLDTPKEYTLCLLNHPNYLPDSGESLIRASGLPRIDSWSEWQTAVSEWSDPKWVKAASFGRLRDERRTELGWTEDLAVWIQTMAGAEEGRIPESSAWSRALEILAFRKMVQVIESPISLSELGSSWAESFELAQFVPTQSGEGVQVFSRAEQISPRKHVFALGLLEGLFPRRRSEDPILCDDERREFEQAIGAVDALETSHEIAARERDAFLLLCSKCRESFTLSYPISDDDRDNVPAFYLTEILRLGGDSVEQIHHPRTQLFGPEGSPIPFDARLSAAWGRPKRESKSEKVTEPTALEAIRPSLDDAFSLPDLRSASECHFRYVCRSRLRLHIDRAFDPWGVRRMLPTLVQAPRHDQPGELRKALLSQLETEISALGAEAKDEQIQLLRAGSEPWVDEWVEQEMRSREIWPRSDTFFESPVSFGSESLQSEFEIDGTTVRFSGTVASVRDQGPFRVAQVYGARKELADLKISDKTSSGAILEVGAYLIGVRTRNRDAAVEFSNHDSRSLVVLDLPADQRLQADAKQNLRVVNLNSRETKFLSHFRDLLKRVVDDVRQNHMETNPGEHCTFCEFGEFCRSSAEFGETSDGSGGTD